MLNNTLRGLRINGKISLRLLQVLEVLGLEKAEDVLNVADEQVARTKGCGVVTLREFDKFKAEIQQLKNEEELKKAEKNIGAVEFLKKFIGKKLYRYNGLFFEYGFRKELEEIEESEKFNLINLKFKFGELGIPVSEIHSVEVLPTITFITFVARNSEYIRLAFMN